MTRTHKSEDVQVVSSIEILACRNEVEQAMYQYGGKSKFYPHTSLGWSVYFDYNENKKMALKVQPAETHDEMVAVWDLHVISESLEDFIEIYSKWYKMYKVPHMEASKSGGDDDDA